MLLLCRCCALFQVAALEAERETLYAENQALNKQQVGEAAG